jgi:hypothetical protein
VVSLDQGRTKSQWGSNPLEPVGLGLAIHSTEQKKRALSDIIWDAVNLVAANQRSTIDSTVMSLYFCGKFDFGCIYKQYNSN